MILKGDSLRNECRHLALEESIDDSLGIQVAQVGVGLTSAYKHDWLARHVGH